MMRWSMPGFISVGLVGLLLAVSVKAEPLGGDFSLIDHHGSTFELKQFEV